MRGAVAGQDVSARVQSKGSARKCGHAKASAGALLHAVMQLVVQEEVFWG